MTEPHNALLSELRERAEFARSMGNMTYCEDLVCRAADEIERLLRGDFTEDEWANIVSRIKFVPTRGERTSGMD